jgi:predicted homoserine dehydrogenase-like protein
VYAELLALERAGSPIRVAVLGAGGSMGQGLALQCGMTPGVRMVAAIDIDLPSAERAAELHGLPWTRASSEAAVRAGLKAGKTVVTSHPAPVLAEGRGAVDILVESTTSVAAAAAAVESALRMKIDVVLMNAEVDCLLGPSLHRTAHGSGAIVTSDAGDQHGVLMRMLDEVRLWGFEIVMAGNIKGFLDRAATSRSVAAEARKRKLNPVMCAAYTDGTKLNIEMALVADATGLVPARRGMLGPRADHVHEVLSMFDLDDLRSPGVVDYILGAEPGGGVFVVGYCDVPVQRDYLAYYKMGEGPFYLFYRPYHLCHLETTHALARVAIERKPVFAPLDRPVAEVIAVAKTDLPAGTVISRAIGGDHVYGEVEERGAAAAAVPICLLEQEEGHAARTTRPVAMGEPVLWTDIELPESDLFTAWRRQEEWLGDAGTSGPQAGATEG